MSPESGLCIGCKRTKEEIGKWLKINDAERESIMTSLEKRDATSAIKQCYVCESTDVPEEVSKPPYLCNSCIESFRQRELMKKSYDTK